MSLKLSTLELGSKAPGFALLETTDKILYAAHTAAKNGVGEEKLLFEALKNTNPSVTTVETLVEAIELFETTPGFFGKDGVGHKVIKYGSSLKPGA